MRDFHGRVAVITGAASGIGRAIANECLRRKMKVVLADVDGRALGAVERAFRAQHAGSTIHSTVVDVTRTEDIQRMHDETIDAFGKVHLLFSNAGAAGPVRGWGRRNIARRSPAAKLDFVWRLLAAWAPGRARCSPRRIRGSGSSD